MAIRLGLLALVSLGLASSASAQAPQNPVCAAYKRNFDRVAGSDDAAAMGKALADIPPACEGIRQAAQGVVSASRKRAADRERARKEQQQREAAAQEQAAAERALADRRDDAAYDSAVAANTVSGFDTYLSAYPSGRHIWQARSTRQALVDAAKPKHINFTLCNKSTVDIVVAATFQPVGERAKWRYYGWYKLLKGECKYLFDTDNQNIFLWGEQSGNNASYWGGKEVEGRKPTNACLSYPGPYDFMLDPTATCPANAVVKQFLWIQATNATGPYTFAFN